jgi:hypothetical protein
MKHQRHPQYKISFYNAQKFKLQQNLDPSFLKGPQSKQHMWENSRKESVSKRNMKILHFALRPT